MVEREERVRKEGKEVSRVRSIEEHTRGRAMKTLSQYTSGSSLVHYISLQQCIIHATGITMIITFSHSKLFILLFSFTY